MLVKGFRMLPLLGALLGAFPSVATSVAPPVKDLDDARWRHPELDTKTIRRTELTNETDLTAAEAVFVVTYIHLFDTISECITDTDDFWEISMEISCGEGGRPEAVGISPTLLEACTYEDDNDQVMTCRHEFLSQRTGQGPGFTFYYKCVGAPEQASAFDTTVTVPELNDIVCYDEGLNAVNPSFLIRTLNVQRVCRNLDLPGTLLFYFGEERACDAAADGPPDNWIGCKGTLSCLFLGQECANFLPAMSFFLEGSPALLPHNCLFPTESFPATIQNRTTETPLDALVRLQYVVVWSSSAWAPCAITRRTQTILRCGEGGQINIKGYEVDETEQILAALGCTRLSRDSLQCTIDVGETAELVSTLEATCQGSTLESLVLEVDWEPENMFCSGPDNLQALQLGRAAHGLEIVQYCPDLPPLNDIIRYPHDKFVTLHGQECAALVDISSYTIVADWIDHDLDGEADENEVYVLEVPSCLRESPNCQGNAINYCEDDSGKQAIETLRNRAALESIVAGDPLCQLPLAPEIVWEEVVAGNDPASGQVNEDPPEEEEADIVLEEAANEEQAIEEAAGDDPTGQTNADQLEEKEAGEDTPDQTNEDQPAVGHARMEAVANSTNSAAAIGSKVAPSSIPSAAPSADVLDHLFQNETGSNEEDISDDMASEGSEQPPLIFSSHAELPRTAIALISTASFLSLALTLLSI